LFYERQINCLTEPERSLVELFRLTFAATPPYTLPEAVYDLFWLVAGDAADVRKAVFETEFSIVMVSIGEIGFVSALNWAWFEGYNYAVLSGAVSITAPCPCISF